MINGVVAIDIDGTLGDHYTHFANFAELWLGRTVNFNPVAGWVAGNPKFQFARALGIGKSTYRQIKLAYRQGGMKRSMPVYDGAAELTKSLRRMGIDVWICTSRPYLRLDSIDPDTRHWLRVNHIQYDHMIYGDYKYRDLVKLVSHDKIVCVLDDLVEMITQAERARLPAMIIERPHNMNRPNHGKLVATDLADANKQIMEMVINAKTKA
jgi:hypothetical protein